VLRVIVCLRTVQPMRAFMYGHNITIRDQANIVNIEKLLFSLKKKNVAKQMWINDFLKISNANWT
jgi:hypothetical protein